MPRGYPSLTDDQKKEVVNRIKEKGEKVPELAKEYGVAPGNIYALLARQNLGQSSGSVLELSKLKREKEALLKIVGQLIVDQKLGKKILNRYGN